MKYAFSIFLILLGNLTFAQVGTNGFHWVPIDKIPCKNFRMYQEVQWTWTADGLAVEPTRQADGNYDIWLKAAKQRGISTVFCPNRVPNWWFTDAQRASDVECPDRRLHKWGLNGIAPADYADICAYYWQLTARYGRVKYPETMLRVNQIPRWTNDPITKKLSGLNLLNYIEVENEPDRPWKGQTHKYTPEQYAALLSAAYDGHEGRLGPIGIKNADPSMKVVLGGLSAINVTYLKQMSNWFKLNRTDRKFPCDVINVHHYANARNPWPGESIDLLRGEGVSPEADNLPTRLDSLMAFVNRTFGKNKVEVWYSEFGWDTQPYVGYPAPPTWLSQFPKLYNRRTAQELQGIWAARTYLISISKGLTCAHIYNASDEPAWESGNLFQSSGFMSSQQTGFKLKASYNWIKWTQTQTEGWKFTKNRSVDGVTILEFKRGPKYKYFYWCPTSNDTVKRIIIGSTTLDATENPNAFETFVPLFGRLVNKHPKVKSQE